MQWNKKFKLVEKALGFELKQWQKDFISMKSDTLHTDVRQSGNTTAFILRHLLNNEHQLYLFGSNIPEYLLFPCDHDDTYQYRNNFYGKEVIRLYDKLSEECIETSLDDFYKNKIEKICDKLINGTSVKKEGETE